MMRATRRELVMGAAAATAIGDARAAAGAAPPWADPAAERAAALLARLFEQKPAPALSMAVADAGRARWAAALGHADLELGVAATTDHVFPLGSVSKVLTATAAARLATGRVIGLDSPIVEWLPDLPEQHRQTTLRQLLTHRGGIRHYAPLEIDMGAPNGAIYMRFYPTDADVLRLFINDPLVAAPGTAVNYSSFGYTLASVAMAAAARRPFLPLIDQEIGRAFGLSSLRPDDPWSITPARAGQYLNVMDAKMLGTRLAGAAQPRLANGWANVPFNNPAYCWAGAGFLMTPTDAARFGASMISPGGPLSQDQHDLLFTPVTAATKTSPPLGLGWRVDVDKKGRRRWHHAGATPGGCFLLAIYPDQRLSIALAGNVMIMPMNAMQAASDLIDIFS